LKDEPEQKTESPDLPQGSAATTLLAELTEWRLRKIKAQTLLLEVRIREFTADELPPHPDEVGNDIEHDWQGGKR